MCLLCASLTNYAQKWTKKINDPDWHNRRSNGLQIGDKMPDLPLGSVLNNKTGKTRFSEFKGKLVILDFWTSWCQSCVAGFPKMEKLQKEFGDQIQIILVNPDPSETTIEAIHKKHPELKLPDLPSIITDDAGNLKKLLKLLPIANLGHQVWIDKDGTILLRGSSLNNTSKRIRDCLNGKEIFFMRDNSTVPVFDPNYPYFKLLGDFKNTSVSYGAFFTRFNNEYEAEGMGKVEGILDTVSGIFRSTYVNFSPLYLYQNAFNKEIESGARDILYYYNHKSAGMAKYFIIPKDTMRYSFSFHGIENINDAEYIKHKFCYEQIVPMGLTEKQRKTYMQQDLNRYFGNLYGTEAKMEKRIVSCYVLVRTSDKDKLESKAKERSTLKVSKNGKSLVKYEQTGLYVLNDVILNSPLLSSFFIQNAKNGEAALLLNETGFKQNMPIDLMLPESKDLKSIEDLRRALQPYDIDIQLVKREMQFVVITDNSGS